VLPVEIDGEVYVDAFVHPVPVGTRLRAIDGRPAAAWLDALGAFASVDGGRAEVRRAAAARHFAAWAHRAHGPQDTWEITTESPEGAVQTWTVPGLSLDAARALDAGRRSAPGRGAPVADPGLAWLSGPPGTAVLRLARFATREIDVWERVLDDGFGALRGDETLVLDLRGNAGGYRDLGLAVARRVTGEAPPQWAAMTVRVRSIPLRFRRDVSFLAAPARALRRFPGAPVAGGWRQVGDPLAAALRADLSSVAPHRGPVVAFVDDATSSAAVELAVSVRAARPALRVVGTPTAGACDRHTGEIPVTYPLGDGVVWLVSLAELTLVPAPGCRAGDGLPIDVPVVLRQEDWAAGRDPWWEALAATGGGPAAPREGGVAGETVVSPAPN
jgi:hypothetical protein